MYMYIVRKCVYVCVCVCACIIKFVYVQTCRCVRVGSCARRGSIVTPGGVHLCLCLSIFAYRIHRVCESAASACIHTSACDDTYVPLLRPRLLLLPAFFSLISLSRIPLPSPLFSFPSSFVMVARSLHDWSVSLDGSHQVYTKPLEVPDSDDREYRLLRLANHLEVLLISDPETDRASAALDVHVGNLSDPVSESKE